MGRLRQQAGSAAASVGLAVKWEGTKLAHHAKDGPPCAAAHPRIVANDSASLRGRKIG